MDSEPTPLDSIRRLYGWGSGVYDLAFGRILDPGRRLAVEYVNRSDARRVLEVGVGTGLSLPSYRRDLSIVGVDLSAEMLAQARRRVTARRLTQVSELLEMDAQSLAFADDVFDAAVAMYVAAVVPDPTRMLGELKRVVRSGGHVYIVNHFAAARGFAGLVDRLAVPLTRRLHLRSDFSLDWLIEHAGMKLDGIANANLAGYVKVVRFRKTSP